MSRAWFRSSALLGPLNTIAVGLALAGSASSILSRVLSGTMDPSSPSWPIAAPTLVLGTIWAWGLRTKLRVGRSRILVGWLASIPLAALNAGFATLLVLGSAWQSSWGAFIAGMTVGGIVWVPSLVVTLLCFGLPIAWARQAAAKGLMGEERGEIAVGVAAVVMSLVGVAASYDRVAVVVSLAGLTAGGVATSFALVRNRQRNDFLARVEAGSVAGFRVEATPEGRALVRVAPATGSGYRVAVFDEEVIPLEGSLLPLRARSVGR